MSSLLDLNNVALHFPNVEKPILSGITFQVKPGDFIIILGSNGSGKSSLLKLLDRRYSNSTGKIFLKEKLIQQYSSKNLSELISTLTQNYHESLFTSLTVFENYLLVKREHQKNEREFLSQYLSQFNLNLAEKLDQIVEKLSGGEKQALALALTVLHPPEILLLDEHTSALDPKSAQQIMTLTQNVVTKHNMTCILTTHNLDIALKYGNRILAMKDGVIHKHIEHQDKQELDTKELLTVCY